MLAVLHCLRGRLSSATATTWSLPEWDMLPWFFMQHIATMMFFLKLESESSFFTACWVGYLGPARPKKKACGDVSLIFVVQQACLPAADNHVIQVPITSLHGKCLESQRCSAARLGRVEVRNLAIAIHFNDWTIERARVSFLDPLLLVCYVCYVHQWPLDTGSIFESSTKFG